jgi:hypothetical protein
MFRTIAFSAALIVLASVVPAVAADETAAAAAPAARADRAAEPAPAADLDASVTMFVGPKRAPAPSRGGLLPSLYMSLAGLQAYDALTTMRGLSAGAVEANAVMGGLAQSPIALVAVKSSITAGSILMAEHLWKSGHKAHAIGMMMASNAVMVFVGARNSSVPGPQR